MTDSVDIDIPDARAMTDFGRRLASHLFPGTVVALNGSLGAGKTFLVRAVAEGLGIGNPAAVTSPTYVLIQEYEARLPIYHFDAYRLPSEESFLELGVEEYFPGTGVCLIEWANRVASCLPPEHLTIDITITDESARSLHISGQGTRYEVLLREIGSWTDNTP